MSSSRRTRRDDSISASEPPKVGEAFPALVPQVDMDGNETSGIRLPELRFPLATYMGWNLRNPSVGAPTEQYPLIGSMVAFPRTKAEREKSGDPRLSIDERYKDEQEYLGKIESRRPRAGEGSVSARSGHSSGCRASEAALGTAARSNVILSRLGSA